MEGTRMSDRLDQGFANVTKELAMAVRNWKPASLDESLVETKKKDLCTIACDASNVGGGQW